MISRKGFRGFDEPVVSTRVQCPHDWDPDRDMEDKVKDGRVMMWKQI